MLTCLSLLYSGGAGSVLKTKHSGSRGTDQGVVVQATMWASSSSPSSLKATCARQAGSARMTAAVCHGAMLSNTELLMMLTTCPAHAA